MLTHPTITTSSVGGDSWRQNVALSILRWTLVLILEEVAGHDTGVNARVGQHKSDGHLHDKLHSYALLLQSVIGCVMT
jgi:hypothetical protein